MNFIGSLKNNGLVFTGVIIGNICGVIANFIRNRSFFNNDLMSCKNPFNGIQPFVAINNYRELSKNVVSNSITGIFHLIFPLIHLVPVIGFNVYNANCLSKTDKKQIPLRKRISKTIGSIVSPAVHSVALVVGFAALKVTLGEKVAPFGIDISGHTSAQFIFAAHSISGAKNISETATPSQMKMYSGVLIICSITDAIWAYNTAANCHSAVDIVTGIACVAFAELGLQTTKQLWNGGRGLLKKLIFK